MVETEEVTQYQKEVLAELKTISKQTEPKAPKEEKPSKAEPQPTTEKHEHLTHDSVVGFFDENKNCPECQKQHEKLKTHFGAEMLKERKDLEFECDECGLGVRETEEECPSCGGKNAKPRD